MAPQRERRLLFRCARATKSRDRLVGRHRAFAEPICPRLQGFHSIRFEHPRPAARAMNAVNDKGDVDCSLDSLERVLSGATR
jgi:hypothetical protein